MQSPMRSSEIRSQVVAVSGVKSQFAVEFDLSGEDAATVPAQLLLHVPARVDESRSAGVGAAGDGPAVFDGPQAGDREEVFVTGRVAPPASFDEISRALALSRTNPP